MKVVIAPEVFHGGEIHSIDLNRNGEILTSGKDTIILQWSIKDLSTLTLDKIKEIKPETSFGYHKASVSVARWNSVKDNVFASGDSEGNVYINTLGVETLVYPQASTLIQSKYQQLLQGKVETGVIDMTWSSEGRLLCWSTQDRKLHLYDTENNSYQEFKSLSQGTQQPAVLRSIAFDPTGNYLITLGDDSLIHLYQYEFYGSGRKDEDKQTFYKFRQIQKISKLVNNMAINCSYKRISWSPDGEYVCIPTANKNQTSLVSLISRSKNWSNIISLVGHDINCEVVKFNPNYYELAKPESGDSLFLTHPFNVIATAGSDKTLVIWNTSSDSPISILKDISNEPICDLCWNAAGDNLYAVSTDGRITIIAFEPEELGKVADEKAIEEITEAGKKLIRPFDHKDESEVTNKRGQTNKQENILDQKDANDNDDEYKETEKADKEAKVTEKAETKVEHTKGSSKTEVRNLVPEVIPHPDLSQKETDILLSVMGRSDKKDESTDDKKVDEGEEKEKVKAKGREKERKDATKEATPLTQKITTKNGKKRIQPMLISNNGSKASLTLSPSSGVSTGISNGNPNGVASNTSMEFDKPSYSVSEDVFRQSKRLKQPESANGSKKLKRQLEPVKFIETIIVNPNTTFAKVRLAVPKVRLAFQQESKNDNEVFVLDIKNGSGNEAKPSRITYYKKDKEIWSDFVPRFIQLATEGQTFWALSSMDGQVIIYSKISGRRILPPLIIGSPLSFLESHGDYLMAVSSIGELYVWNIALKKIHLVSPTSLSSVLELSNKYKEDGLSKSDNITMCSITSTGVPLLTLSNGTGYLFNKDLSIWQTISESWWAFGSHYWDSVNNDGPSKNPSLQSTSIIGSGVP